jgi:hypothetical protein
VANRSGVAEEKLNLLEARLQPPDIKERTSAEGRVARAYRADPCGEFFNFVPNQLLSNSVAQGLPPLLTFSEELSCLNSRRYYPVVQ